jgi:hypothetical protein
MKKKKFTIFHFYKDSCSKFDICTAMTINSTAFWRVTPCSLVEVYRRFGGTYYLHLHTRRVTLVISKPSCFLLVLLLGYENRGGTFLRNVGKLPDYAIR